MATRTEIALYSLLAASVALFLYSLTDSGARVLASVADSAGALFMTRGIRNCNPGNIRIGSGWKNSYRNQAECEAAGRVWDSEFVVFYTMADGVRALGHLLLNYQSDYGIDTIDGIVSRYAPASDNNDTASYINFVAGELGVSPGTHLAVNDSLTPLASAIMFRETGYQNAPSVIDQWVHMS